MRKRILRALLVLGLLVGSLTAASSAQAYFIDSPRAAAAAAPAAVGFVPSTTERGYCIKVGTGDFRNLWLDANTHKCPIYSATDAYWGPVTLGGAGVGPAGP